jgi:hypothetical protein
MQSIGGDEKIDPKTLAASGYRLDRYRFRDRYRLEIWHEAYSQRVQFSYEGLAYWKSPEVVEQRWLAGDKALYLRLGLGLENSLPQQRTDARIIYDFERGQLYVFSSYWLWRRPLEANESRDRWMTESEFEEVLKSLEKEN